MLHRRHRFRQPIRINFDARAAGGRAAPQVFYKLDEIIYQFLKNDGDVVALGLDYMARNSKLPFKYSPEIKFQKAASQFGGEVDLCAVWDGELTVGEAKKQRELAATLNEVQKIVREYLYLATMLSARRVVFCPSSSEWKSSTVEAVRTAFRDTHAAPQFPVAADLFGKFFVSSVTIRLDISTLTAEQTSQLLKSSS
jgi:hypothetical protein